MKFNLRVYGILVNEKKQVLVADEFIRGNYYTKFPGGGLEFGEGTRDCLKREYKELLSRKKPFPRRITRRSRLSQGS